ncbi:CAF17-like 4Fe-4S cluster assembly/insertion protein YgfZ [Anaeromyxobacter sp. SG26]|uniref:CAF17-like 4Fe-4S cluster assembly/insertion protein YgfZ n=1 Tax=Anaeromyxobacter sp. SG26 TaxID=2925407 RepID=UPI001F55BD9D|nr:folate-binding protein [Anaeromyxobacter sp. SG26]
MTTLSEKLRAARETWAVGPVEARALVRATGKDAKDYLHRMSTQDLNRLRPGESAYATFLNAKGHLLAEGHVLAQEEGLLLDLAPQALPDALAHLERLVIMDEVVFEDLSSALRVVPVLGPEAARRVEGRAPGAQRLAHDRRGTPGVDVILPPQEAEALRAELVADGAVALEDSDLEALRILGGVPRFGADVDSTRLPMEAGLTRAAISFTKGCYIGQEVVLRATARGHLQRGLVQLALPAGAGPGTRLAAAGQEVGVVTSAADTPEGRIGLGYLRRAHWKCGAAVDAGGEPATVRRVLVEEPEL